MDGNGKKKKKQCITLRQTRNRTCCKYRSLDQSKTWLRSFGGYRHFNNISMISYDINIIIKSAVLSILIIYL